MKNTLEKLGVGLLTVAMMVLSFATPQAHAAGEKFVMNAVAYADSTHMYAVFDVVDGTNVTPDNVTTFAVSGILSEDALRTAELNAVVAWANTHGYSASTSDVIMGFKPMIGKVYEGTTQRMGAFPIFKSVTVSSGTAIFYLTDDGTSTGNALFPNGVIADSVNAFVSDAAASYQMAYAFSNSNKTLTVTTNKLTTANILTGILGQSAANGASVKLQVWGY